MRVLDPAAVAEWPLSGDRRMAMLAARIRAAEKPLGWPQIALGVLVFAGFVVGLLGVQFVFSSQPRWVHMLVIMVLAMAFGSAATRARRKWAAPSLAQLLIEEGLCPSCGYNFFGLSADAEGFLQCPECGAAWRAERVRRVEAFAPSTRMVDANTVVGLAGGSRVMSDDRGSRRPVVHPRLRKEIAAATVDADRARLRAARAEIGRGGRLVRWLTAAVVASPGVAFVYLLLSLRVTAPVSMIVTSSISACFFVCLAVGVLYGNFLYTPGAVRRGMLGQGLCPSCAASVEGCEAEADGCAVCPGCLAAWRTGV